MGESLSKIVCDTFGTLVFFLVEVKTMEVFAGVLAFFFFTELLTASPYFFSYRCGILG